MKTLTDKNKSKFTKEILDILLETMAGLSWFMA